ncbi:YybH family protein [Burkholderia alba]|uniref:YybH family protein n=1 Tax=Burkholderia alba TaxID=2683677 RepID=UPI002B05F453|nr:nuclear transport factor 2 family protein [Burkholderia alba]
MTDPTAAEIRHVYDAWHAAVVARDLDALLALYADDAILETPLILVVQPELRSGVLRGKDALRAFFSAGLRDTPDGDQTDLVEVMDLAHGRIAHHRVYWGWVGFRGLAAALAERRAS